MRIGILSTCEHYEWAGTEEVWCHFARKAMQQGHEVVLGAHAKVAASKQVAELQSEGLKVCVRNPRRPIRLYLMKERWRSEMTPLLKSDVVVVNSGSLFDTLNLPWIGQFLLTLNAAKKPVVYFCHFCAESLPATSHDPQSVKAFLDCISRWVFVSKHNLNLAERQLASKLIDSHVVMNGPRLTLSEPLPFPEASTLTFGCVARMEIRWKGHDVLLDCLSKENWRDRDWRLNLYGSGPDEKHIQKLIRHYNLESKVQMCGYVRNMKDVWSNCHAKVLASHGEGTPLAVLEAMMCGRPTITTDVGGNLEILNEGKTGFIADAASPRSFGQALERAWQQRQTWPEMGRQAHCVAKKLSDNDPAENLLKLIEEGA